MSVEDNHKQPFETLKSQLEIYKGVQCQIDIPFDTMTVKIPSNQGLFTLKNMDTDEVGALLFSARGNSFEYHPESVLRTVAKASGHELVLIKKEV